MVIAAMLILAVSVLPAAAEMLVTVRATSGNLTAVQEFLINAADGWALPAPVALIVDGVQLGTLKNLDILTDVDPFVNLRFAVEAGSLETTFNIISSVVSFSALVNPYAYATAGVTLTSDFDGATITGLFDGKAYQARYNSSIVYADLVNGYTIFEDTTVTATDRSPAIGTQTIYDSLSSIQSEFSFTLSALDQASGTSRFEITPGVPEPATFSLLALGGLAILKRRKQKLTRAL